MKHLIPFRIYESQMTSGLTQKQKNFLTRYTKGSWSVNLQTGLVDVQGHFNCNFKSLKNLSGISFGHVSGNFSCLNNQLTSLVGAPQTVGGTFYCVSNQLTSLTGAPQTVDGDFYCFSNRLTSLAGAPQTVGGKFTCDEFQLDSGEWNMQGWLEVLNTGTPAAQKLILTLPWIQPDWWNQELQRDPGKTVHMLSTMWKHMPKNMQSAIKIPKGYEDQLDLFSGFDELGLF